MKKINKKRSYFSNQIGILLIIFLISIFFVYNSFSISNNTENSLTNILYEDFFPLITVEYESDSTIVLKGDENSLLILNGTLAPLWNAIDIVKNNGYKLKEITESGMGSQGNPTRFYAILEKEKTSISAKETNKNLTTEELVNETVALENETIKGQQEEQEQIGGSTILKEQLKLVQGKLNQSDSFSDSGSQSLDKRAQSIQEKIKNQTYQLEDTEKAEETENWIKGESDKLSFMYPSHWNVDVSDSRFDNYELLLWDQASNSYIRVSDEALSPANKILHGNNLERYFNIYMMQHSLLSSDSNKIDTYPEGKVSIAGLPAYSELYLDQGYAILISLVFQEGNDRHYTVVSRSPSSQYDKLEPIMLEIIKSITPKTIQKQSDHEIAVSSNNTDFGNNKDATEELQTTTEGAKYIGKNLTEGAKGLAESISKGLKNLEK